MGVWTVISAIGPSASGNIAPFSWHRLAAVVWLAGALLVLLFWAVQYIKMQHILRRQGRPAPDAWQTL